MTSEEIIGFEDADSFNETHELSKKSNVNKKKGGGGFQVMGLSHPVLKGIQKRGYKIPTPIQRKTIPIALQGRDLVAMARTGSGKTACFLIPIFERLKGRCAKTGARALVISPTRELALQTLKFIRELARFMDLKAAIVLGGDSMDSQFEALHGNPDIIVATPGRFMHLCVEMELKLNSVEIVVFDEADRLFEMGFGEQLKDIVARLPAGRQTLLFSATLPKVLVEFTRAGLSDPILLRLDVESKLPEELQLAFLWSRPEEKIATLLCLLRQVLSSSLGGVPQQTIIFAATRHHVEYLHMLLEESGIPNTFLYSNLDPSARKINAAKFREGVVKVMVVTDVAARGRCARAGRSGTAYSIVSRDEVPYLVDLHMFLGRPVVLAGQQVLGESKGLVGCVPADLLEEQHSEVLTWHTNKIDLEEMAKVCSNAYGKYLKSRPGASVDSVRRAKQLDLAVASPHPMFRDIESKSEAATDILQRMKHFRPSGTIFELCPKANSEEVKVMKQKRSFHEKAIEGFHRKIKEQAEATFDATDAPVVNKLAPSTPEDLKNIFSSILGPRKRKFDPDYSKHHKKFKSSNIDTDNFVPYIAADHHTETGLAVNSFEQTAGQLAMDLIGDDEKHLQRQQSVKKWDERRKKMVGAKEQVKKIRSESGVWIKASYKSGRYQQWKEKSKADEAASDSDNSDAEEKTPQKGGRFGGPHRGRGRGGQQGGSQRVRSELRRPDQILKAREKKERSKRQYNKGMQRKRQNSKGRGGGGKRGKGRN
ncbi:hypothetical protein B566_EDAN012693 [Ephemera danica]|nr:hypothetical protein B566_EDAN012693 [Ephemera danica]